MQIPSTNLSTIKYALKLIDSLFIDKRDFQNISVKHVDKDPRIKAIYGRRRRFAREHVHRHDVALFLADVIQHRFGYSYNDMLFVWPPIHDSILSKRRNQRKLLSCESSLGERA